jgi:hypothetical protein
MSRVWIVLLVAVELWWGLAPEPTFRHVLTAIYRVGGGH